ncbi:MAG: undecaprenyldiphospho-muramoylpentapeptide beta-N-acetylglucosaminyltransferase [Desulfobacterales bacterium]|nr:undecaprenyldiphospho-muramoylpentapeptide beta-N-acetylglucosaminyltransferase [Desulfobacterales bacterium]
MNSPLQDASPHQNKADGPSRILIAGGGTGGHLFPAIAIAEAFMARDPGNHVTFVAAGTSFDRSVLPKTGFDYEFIKAEGLKGRGLKRQFAALMKSPAWILGAIRLLSRLKPDLVLGVGAYSAGPMVLGAWLMRKPIALHEQNRIPGVTNRILAPLANRIYVSFEETAAGWSPKKALHTGNPVRRLILAAGRVNEKRINTGRFTVLIIGGSQGARPVNDAVKAALERLPSKERFYFLHQTGPHDERDVKEAYDRTGTPGEVKKFFHDMGRRYLSADLIICRAGATTVAEVTAVGRPAILIPFPFAADDHQTRNARALSDIGAGELLHQKDLDGARLAERIRYYADHPDVRESMVAAARKCGHPRAARTIVEDCYKLMGK